jgi:hypothetical protein
LGSNRSLAFIAADGDIPFRVEEDKFMNSRTWMVIALLGVLVFCGCTRRYVLTYTNGASVTVYGKPKQQSGSYLVKDAEGKTYLVPGGRIREIAPASMSKSTKAQFNPSTSR